MLRRGHLARRADQLAEAREHFAQAASISRRNGSRRLLVSALKGVAQIERDNGRPGDSVPFYEEAVSLCRQIGDHVLQAHTIRHLGDAYQDIESLENAAECYREALSLYRESGHAGHLDLANAVRPFAILKERMGDTSGASELWREAHQLYSSVNARAGIDESAIHLQKLGG
jgi:tetratricopeptide (TPR) repeat protein